MLVVNQMNDFWNISKGKRYSNFAIKAKELISNFTDVSIYWIPRELNTDADALSNKVLREKGIKIFGE